MFPEPLVCAHQALASGFQVSATCSPITRRSASIAPPGLVAAAPGSHLKDVPAFQAFFGSMLAAKFSYPLFLDIVGI